MGDMAIDMPEITAGVDNVADQLFELFGFWGRGRGGWCQSMGLIGAEERMRKGRLDIGESMGKLGEKRKHGKGSEVSVRGEYTHYIWGR